MSRSDYAAPSPEDLERIDALGFVRRGMPIESDVIRWSASDLSFGLLFHPFNSLPWGCYWRDDVTGKFYTAFACDQGTCIAVLEMASQR